MDREARTLEKVLASIGRLDDLGPGRDASQQTHPIRRARASISIRRSFAVVRMGESWLATAGSGGSRPCRA
jgi:hypothetical protein